MSDLYRPGDTFSTGFTTNDTTGALVWNAAGVYLQKNAVDDTNTTFTIGTPRQGHVSVSCTWSAGYVGGDSLTLFGTASIGGVSVSAPIFHTRLVGFDPTQATVPANVLRVTGTPINAPIAGRIDANAQAASANLAIGSVGGTPINTQVWADTNTFAAGSKGDSLATAALGNLKTVYGTPIKALISNRLDVNVQATAATLTFDQVGSVTSVTNPVTYLGTPNSNLISVYGTPIKALRSGRLDVDVQATAATLTFDRVGNLIGMVGGTPINQQVWGDNVTYGVGTKGAALAAAGGAGDPWATVIPGSYTPTQAGYIVGNRLGTPLATQVWGEAIPAGYGPDVAGGKLDTAASGNLKTVYGTPIAALRTGGRLDVDAMLAERLSTFRYGRIRIPSASGLRARHSRRREVRGIRGQRLLPDTVTPRPMATSWRIASEHLSLFRFGRIAQRTP